MNVAVVGASGGIGSAFLRQLESDSSVSKILAYSRKPGTAGGGKVEHFPIDLTNQTSIERAVSVAVAHSPLDLVILASGLLHSASVAPEKTMGSVDFATMRSVFEVNAIGPALLAAGLLPLMRKDGKSVFAALSARVGSIADNRLGGWVSYRASKAALNMVLRTFSIEQARKNPRCVVVGLHPGTVDTALSEPFATRNAGKQLFHPDEAAANLLAVIDSLSADDSGGFFAWDGAAIEY